MKIYFEDGKLERPNSIDFKYNYIIDAGWGFTHNISMLDFIMSTYSSASIYTNSLVALNNRYAWNKELGVPEIYLWKNDKFIRIDQLTNRELREAHNLEKMYISGEFNDLKSDYMR